MKIVSRRKEDPSKVEGRDYVEEYEKNAVKDVVLLGSNEVVEVLAKFQPYPGVYVCYIPALVDVPANISADVPLPQRSPRRQWHDGNL
jgi:hypothetical protein